MAELVPLVWDTADNNVPNTLLVSDRADKVRAIYVQ